MSIPIILKQKVKQYFNKNKDKDNKKLTPCRISSLLKKNKKLEQQLLNFLNIDNNKEIYLSKSGIVNFILYDKKDRYCKNCGKLLNIKQLKYCSTKCSMALEQNPFNRYKDKIHSKNLEKYGHINPFGSKQIQQKIKNINLQKYGVENPFQNQEIKQKIKKTNLQKYGYENPMQVKQIKEKAQQNMLQKYGVKFPRQSIEIKNKIKQNNINKFGYQSHSQLQILSLSNVIPMFDVNEFIDKSKVYKWKCKFCGNQFYARYYNGIVKKKCKCIKLAGFSKLQKQLAKFCKQYYPNLIQNDRKVIKPYQLDIVIPQIKLAIQFNGCYFHNMDNIPFNYHLMKTQMCQARGYRLIHIWQDQWKQDKEKIKAKLSNIFQNNEEIIKNTVLDRCWYSILQFQKYQIIQPQIILRNNYKIVNCGYLKVF